MCGINTLLFTFEMKLMLWRDIKHAVIPIENKHTDTDAMYIPKLIHLSALS